MSHLDVSISRFAMPHCQRMVVVLAEHCAHSQQGSCRAECGCIISLWHFFSGGGAGHAAFGHLHFAWVGQIQRIAHFNTLRSAPVHLASFYLILFVCISAGSSLFCIFGKFEFHNVLDS